MIYSLFNLFICSLFPLHTLLFINSLYFLENLLTKEGLEHRQSHPLYSIPPTNHPLHGM